MLASTVRYHRGAEPQRASAAFAKLHEDQQADVLSIRVPPGMDTAAATLWKKDVFPTLYGEDEARRPRDDLKSGS